MDQALYHTKPKLLAILQMGGATGQTFTAEQVVRFLGKYIEKKKLYDPVNKRLIRCENDLLGEAFQVQQFIVSDFTNLWKYIAPCLQQAAMRDLSLQQLEPKEGESSSSSELPWWFYVKRDKPDLTNLSETTGKDSYADRETVGVQDSEYEDSVQEDLGKEAYLEEFEPVSEVDSDSTEPVTSDEDTIPVSEIANLQQDVSDVDDDSTVFTDSEISLEEHWKCSECWAKNPPSVGYCQHCWKMRKGWIEKREKELSQDFKNVCSSSADSVATGEMSLDVFDGKTDNCPTSSDCSTITPTIPSFSSPQKHKLNNNSPDSPLSMETEPERKKLHLHNVESNLETQLSGSSSVTTSSSGSSSFAGSCNICRNNPNDAVMVHGNSAHQFCCYRCAKRLKRRGKSCPVCRAPILLVVRNFIVN